MIFFGAPVAAIGFPTFAIVTISAILGCILGLLFGKRSGIVGSLVLIAIGAYIIYLYLAV